MAIDLKRIKQRHVPSVAEDGTEVCDECELMWPCDAIQLADEVGWLRAEARKRVERMIGPEVFRLRRKFCASHTGKGTGLECSDCCADVAEERDKFRAEIARLRAALEFYADMNNYHGLAVMPGAEPEIFDDFGEIAREALNPKTDDKPSEPRE